MPTEATPQLSQLTQISRAMNRIYKEKLGRGPDRVHTHYAGPNGIVCFLEGTLTPVERTLTTIDAHRQLREVRMLVQDAAEAEFCLAVQQITSRPVVASTSGFDVRADVATETFQIAPVPVGS